MDIGSGMFEGAAARVAVALVVGLAIGWLLAMFSGGWRKEAERLRGQLDNERSEGEKAMARLRQELGAKLDQSQEAGEVFQYLPDHIRELFVAQGQRTIGPAVLSLVDRLFHPTQAALFVARSGRKRLALNTGLGLPPSVPSGAEVEYEKGRVGYGSVAQTPMDEADFRRAAGEGHGHSEARRNLEGSGVNGLRVDVIAPIRDDETLLGVLAIGGVRTRKGREKALLGMVADLTAFALLHAMRVRQSEASTQMDGLTGALSQRHLNHRLEDELRACATNGSPLSVLLFDIDEFERYNSMHGHQEGDEVLKRMAGILRGGVRAEDVVGRFGGEEFGVLLLGASKDVAVRVGDTLRQAVADYPFQNREHQPGGRLTVSVGVATCPEDSRRVDDLWACAAEAVLVAKARGRNLLVSGSPNFLR